MDEEWKDIRGYEGRYQVSNIGRIKSLARMRKTKGGGQCFMPEKIMSVSIKKETGRTKPYAEIRLRNGGPREEPCKAFLVHRLVADAFIRKLEPREEVDHENRVHADNRVENLRILTWRKHSEFHPVRENPLPRNDYTGRFMKRNESPKEFIDVKKIPKTDKQIYHFWFLNNVPRQYYWGA